MGVPFRTVATIALLATSGCVAIMGAYIPQALPDAQVHRDITYLEDGDPKHRLDLFVPQHADFPILLFAHGGGWVSGDKNLVVFGHIVNDNLGRYFAARGVGVAVVNYRLQPTVHLAEQVQDVAAATAWLYRHVAGYGGDPLALFLSGHSAGGQLVAHVAYDSRHLKRYDLTSATVRGVVIVSGGALDIGASEHARYPKQARELHGFERSEEEDGRLGPVLRVRTMALRSLLGLWSGLVRLVDRDYFKARFDDGTSDWVRTASPITYVTRTAPPSLVLNAENDPPSLRRQGALIHERLTELDVVTRYEIVTGENHFSLLYALSRDSPVTLAVRCFLSVVKSREEMTFR